MLRFRRVVTAFVAGVYFLTNVMATHAVERSLWEERRSALDRAPRYARLVSPAQSPRFWDSTVFDGGSTTSQPPSIFKNLALPFDVASAVLPYGAIGEVRIGRPGAPVVFLVQDVHGNHGAQKNIGGLLGELSSHGVTLTGVEGAWVPFDLSAYHQHPSPKAVALVAEALRDSGRLSGSEWAGLTAPHPPTLVGVESPGLYHANVTAAQECVARRPSTASFLASLNKTLQSHKERYYSPTLKTFDHHLTEYHKGHEGLAAYTRFLSGLPGGKTQAGAQVKIFLKAMEWESRLNFDAIEADRRALMDRLAKDLDQRALDSLLSQSMAYRAGKQTNGDFFSYLKTLCAKSHIPLESYPSFANYIAYVGLVQSIRRVDFLDELSLWETALGSSLAKTPEEQCVLVLDRDAALLRQLLENEMSPEAWTQFTKRRNAIVSLPARLREWGDFQEPQEGMPAFFRPHEDFCRLAMERNGALVSNFIRQVETQKAPHSVLVTGGFHTPGLQSELQKRGYSTVVVTPRIEKVEGKPLDVFARDPLPFDQLFAGKPISLSPELLLNHSIGKSFINLTITAEALSFVPGNMSRKKSREWLSGQRYVVKKEIYSSNGLVHLWINGREFGVRLLVGPKGAVERTRISDQEFVEKVDLSNGQTIWLSANSLQTRRIRGDTPILGRIFFWIKNGIEKMEFHWPDIFAKDESTSIVGKMFHRVFPLPSIRPTILPTGALIREESPTHFLAEPYLRYDLLLRKIVNPWGGAYSLLYGGSGADLSNGLLLSNFTRAFFVSPTHGLTVSDLNQIKRNEVREDPLYAHEKHDDGFSDGSRLNGKEKLLSSLSLELKGMSVQVESMEAFEWKGRPGVRFLWKAPGETTPSLREIIFVNADITQPAQYRDVLSERFDLYLQRAGMLIPWAYRDRNSFIKVIAGSMNPGAFFATDDDALDEPGEFIDQGHHFPLDLPVVPVPGEQELLDQVIALRYQRAGLRAWPNRQKRKGYGFLLRVRRMPEFAMAVPGESNVPGLESVRTGKNENTISISRKGMGISLSMLDKQAQEIGKAVFLGKRGEITVTEVETRSTGKSNALSLLLEVARFGLFEGGDGRILIRATNNNEIVQAAMLLFDAESLLVAPHRFDRVAKNSHWMDRIFPERYDAIFEEMEHSKKQLDVSGGLSREAREALWPDNRVSSDVERKSDGFRHVTLDSRDKMFDVRDEEGNPVGRAICSLTSKSLSLKWIDARPEGIGWGKAALLAVAVEASRILMPELNRHVRPVPLVVENIKDPRTTDILMKYIFKPGTVEAFPTQTDFSLMELGGPISWNEAITENDPRFQLLVHPLAGAEWQRYHLRGELQEYIYALATSRYQGRRLKNNLYFLPLGIPLDPMLAFVLAVIFVGAMLYRDVILEWMVSKKTSPRITNWVAAHLPDLSGDRSALVRLPGGVLGAAESFAGKTFRHSDSGIRVIGRPVNDTLAPPDREAFAEALGNLLSGAFDMKGVEAMVDPHQLASGKRSAEGLQGLLDLKGNSPLTVPDGILDGVVRHDPETILWVRLFASKPLGVQALASRILSAAEGGDAKRAGAALAAWDDSKFLPSPNPEIVAETLAVLFGSNTGTSETVTTAFAEAYNQARSGLLFPKLIGGQLSRPRTASSDAPGIVLNLSALFDETASDNLKGQTWLSLASSLVPLERDPNTPLALVVFGNNNTRAQVEKILSRGLPKVATEVLRSNLFVEGDAGQAKFFTEGKFSLRSLQERPQWQRGLKVLGFSEENLLKDPQWAVELIPLEANRMSDLRRILDLLRFIKVSA